MIPFVHPLFFPKGFDSVLLKPIKTSMGEPPNPEGSRSAIQNKNKNKKQKTKTNKQKKWITQPGQDQHIYAYCIHFEDPRSSLCCVLCYYRSSHRSLVLKFS